MERVTESELLEQVRDALVLTETEDGAMSVLQLADALNMSANAVRDRLRKLIEEGIVQTVRVRRKKMNGIVSPQIAYAPVKSNES
jgi:predicted ArsR family transcriptional regulator|tara:strand:+ start:748 stop:1002 length:255 start_codon:yes stop_codon:yes gene_type:complete